MLFQKVWTSQPAGKGYLRHPEVRSKYPSRAMQPRRSFPSPPSASRRALIFVKVPQDARTTRERVYTRMTKSMRYLTFTTPPSREVRKAILRHRSDVLQIAAIYSATREEHLVVVGSMEFPLRFITSVSIPLIN